MPASTALPAGQQCGNCIHFRMCSAHFHRLAEDRDCEHAPAIFKAAQVRRPVVELGPAPRNERVIRFHPVLKEDRTNEKQRAKYARRKHRKAQAEAAKPAASVAIIVADRQTAIRQRRAEIRRAIQAKEAFPQVTIQFSLFGGTE